VYEGEVAAEGQRGLGRNERHADGTPVRMMGVDVMQWVAGHN